MIIIRSVTRDDTRSAVKTVSAIVSDGREVSEDMIAKLCDDEELCRRVHSWIISGDPSESEDLAWLVTKMMADER